MSTLTTTDGWRLNVGAVVADNAGNILLGCRPESSPYLHFPQGGIKPGESPEQALARELREEMGLSSIPRPIAEYPGLRYTYGKRNDKRGRWCGQQQCFFFVRLPSSCPAVDCSGSAEFSSARWVPASSLSPYDFSPSKRAVAEKVLAHFFPSGCREARGAAELTVEGLYRFPPATPLHGTPLFAGGKKEARQHIFSLPPVQAGAGQRLLVLPVGMRGSGLCKALRNSAPSFAPLTTLFLVSSARYAAHPAACYPLRGEICFLSCGLHAQALQSEGSRRTDLLRAAAAAERSLTDTGTQILKIALFVSQEKQRRRLEKKGEPFCSASYARELSSLREFIHADPGINPWFFLPSDIAWYRDYLLLSLVRHAVTD